MTPMQRSALLTSIANTVADYRRGDIPTITPAHVARWVDQFEPADQPVILTEMDALLKRFYLSRARVKGYLRDFIKTNLVDGQNARAALQRVRFLRLQARGSSQDELLDIVNEILHEDYATDISACGSTSADAFVYLDDGIYTGNKLRYDLTRGQAGAAWIPDQAPSGCTLIVHVMAAHVIGVNYVWPYVKSAAAAKGIVLNGECDIEIDNQRQPGSKAECLWPEEFTGDPDVDWYVQLMRQELAAIGMADPYLFRPNGTPTTETLFSSPAARQTVERAFLKAGARLVLACSTPAPSMRPLGFEKLKSLGLGTLFITYRNIANNCPLVLWWGDPTAGYPLNLWHPLFPRRTNVQISGMMGNGDISPDDIPF